MHEQEAKRRDNALDCIIEKLEQQIADAKAEQARLERYIPINEDLYFVRPSEFLPTNLKEDAE